MVKASKLQQASLSNAQSCIKWFIEELMLQFSLRGSAGESINISATQQYLRQIFNEIISRTLLPGCNLKINIFILNQHANIESALVNACWICLLIHGIPLQKSIWHHQYVASDSKTNKLLIDLQTPNSIILAEYSSLPPQNIKQLCANYKKIIKSNLNQILNV